MAVKLPMTIPLSTITRMDSGISLNTEGTTEIPSPMPMEQATMSKFSFCLKSTVERMRIPEVITIPNIGTIAPPRTALGTMVVIAAILGSNPKTIKMRPAATITERDLILLRATRPTFYEKLV